MVAGMSKRPSAYHSFLLRMWLVEDKGTTIWRASLESPHSGERTNFATLDELFNFLRRQTDQSADNTEGSREVET